MVTVAVALAVAGAGTFVAFASLSGDEEPRAGPTVSPTPSTEPSPSPEPSPTPEPASPAPTSPHPARENFPDSLIALFRDEHDPSGSFVVLSSRTGEDLRVLARVGLAEGIGPPVLAPDGATVYFEQGLSACESEVERLPFVGGEVESVAPGGSPALSSDGRLLAYVPYDPSTCESFDDIVVRDLATGEERHIPGDLPVEPFSGVFDLSWAPDGGHLAFSFPTEGHVEIGVLDTARASSTGDAERLSPNGPRGTQWFVLSYRPDGDLLVLERCCSLGRPAFTRVIVVDPDTGEVVWTVVDLGGADVRWVDADPSGQHFLWVVGDRGRLFRWSGGDPVLVREGVSLATW